MASGVLLAGYRTKSYFTIIRSFSVLYSRRNVLILPRSRELAPSSLWLSSLARHYTNFGHALSKNPHRTGFFYLRMAVIFTSPFFFWNMWGKDDISEDEGEDYVMTEFDADGRRDRHPNLGLVVQAQTLGPSDAACQSGVTHVQKAAEPDDQQVTVTANKDKVGFRDRKIIEYENRIRQYSTPDKIFRYFATLKVCVDQPGGSSVMEVFMTPEDFLRSITPGAKQPEGLGLDQYKRYDPKSMRESLHMGLEADSIFLKLGSRGLISFSDYIFLLTIMSTSSRQFEIAFQMFDFNGDGDVDSEEFDKVSALIRQQTSIGARHRDHNTTGNTLRGINSALSTYFFGPNLDKKLTIDKFLDFQSQLQREVLCLEFRRKTPDDNGNISETDLAQLLLVYGGYPSNRKLKMLKRVRKKFRNSETGVSLSDYLKLHQLLNAIHDVDTALTFYHIAGASIDPVTLKHVARTVAKVELSDHIIDVIITLFDDNNDGQLSNREFVAVMKARANRGLEKPKDTNFVRLLRSIGKCARDAKPYVLGF